MQEDEVRWRKEQEFFDGEEYSEEPIPANTIERYAQCSKPFLAPEYAFYSIGDVRNKRVLEVGCGDGGNAVLLALKGAYVVGIDISPRAIQIAKERAKLHAVQDRVEFFALPVEAYIARAEGRFDVICGFAVLHHLLPVLKEFVEQLKELSTERTIFLFSEPVSLSASLRRLRLALPLAVHGTEDERPLELADLAILSQHLPTMETRLFGFLLRIWGRFIGGRYEDYGFFATRLFDMLAKIDWAILSLPMSRALASTAVLRAGPASSN
ncbi:MAG: class I SAM-dependent methyltransferase [Bryobacteraceae bacterium]